MSSFHLFSVRAPGRRPFAPPQSVFTARFWDALGEGRFMATRCDTCNRFSFPPKPFCPHCWSRSIQWNELRPEGVVYSATIVHAAPKVFQAEAPYHVGIVDLADNIRIATRLLGVGSIAEAIGARCELVVVEYDDGALFAARLLPGFRREGA